MSFSECSNKATYFASKLCLQSFAQIRHAIAHSNVTLPDLFPINRSKHLRYGIIGLVSGGSRVWQNHLYVESDLVKLRFCAAQTLSFLFESGTWKKWPAMKAQPLSISATQCMYVPRLFNRIINIQKHGVKNPVYSHKCFCKIDPPRSSMLTCMSSCYNSYKAQTWHIDIDVRWASLRFFIKVNTL